MERHRVGYALTLLAGLALIAGCGNKAEEAAKAAAADSARAVSLLAASDVATIARTDLAAGVPISGTLAPGWEARVTSPLEDRIEEVLVKEGQRVGRGQVLARFRLVTAQTAASSAQAGLKTAAADHERQKNLLAEGAVSQRDVEAAEAQWKAAQAQAAQANKMLEDATVRAPGAGVVVERAVQSGDRVGAGDPLFTIADTRTLEFEATVPSEFVRYVKPGAAVTLTVSGYPAGSIVGKVARVNASADAATRQVKVYVNVPNHDQRLVGGLFASGDVVTQSAKQVVAVPRAAVHGEAGATWVLVIVDGRIAKRTVRLGVVDESRDLTEVIEGLKPGEVVVTGPPEGLVDGKPVRVAGKER